MLAIFTILSLKRLIEKVIHQISRNRVFILVKRYLLIYYQIEGLVLMFRLIEKMESPEEIKELQMIVNLMSYIAEDLKEISCLESLAVFDEKLNTIFCESKNEIRNTKDGRMKVGEYLKENRKIQQTMRNALKTGLHQKLNEDENKSILIMPILGSRKPIGVIGVIYESDGCEHSNCTTDLILKDIINLFIVKYREMKEKEAMATTACKLKTLEDYEKYAILETGKRCNWNITVMAKELEIGRNTLYSKMKRMGIN